MRSLADEQGQIASPLPAGGRHEAAVGFPPRESVSVDETLAVQKARRGM